MKSLAELDPFYKSTVSKFIKIQKLQYCQALIIRTQQNIRENEEYLCADLKQNLTDLISSAKNEIRKIEGEPDLSPAGSIS
jgi:hypothetical protein